MNDYINSYQNIVISHFSLFPIGLIILSENDSKSSYIVSYINHFASSILPIILGMEIKFFKDVLCTFRKREFNQLSNVTLWDALFNSNYTDCNETFFSDCFMAYIKIKFIEENIYISIDNLNEQRKTLQEKMIKSISYQFLTTLAHELNNPLNSLFSTIEQIVPVHTSSSLLKRIRLLLVLIKTVTKKLVVYSKSIFDSFQLKEKQQHQNQHQQQEKQQQQLPLPHTQYEQINLSYIFTKLVKKFTLLFEYKHITIDTDFSLLEQCLFKCDRYYLKELIKNLWLYIYYQVPKDSKITIVSTIQNCNLVKMTFQHEGTMSKEKKIAIGKCSDKKLISETDIILDASVNTIDTCKDILLKISSFLDVDVVFVEEDNIYLTLDFNNIVFESSSSESDDEEEVDEFNSTSTRKNHSLVPTFSAMNTFDLLKNSKKNINNPSSSKNLSSNLTKELAQLPMPMSDNKKGNVINNTTIAKVDSIKKQKVPSSLSSSFNNNCQYSEICSSLGRSLAKILAEMKDPVLDNMKSTYSMMSNTKSFKKNDEGRFGTNGFNQKSTVKEKDYDEDDNKDKGRKRDYTPNPKSFIHYKPDMTPTSLSTSSSTSIPTPNSNKSNPTIESHSSSILIVDDEDFNVKSLHNMLRLEKQSADFCYNGYESIQYLKQHPNVKLVLMDICMPVMDGIEACKNIEEMVNKQEINANIAVIIISAHPPDIIHSGNLKLKVVKDFFKKPLSRSKLKEILKEYKLV